MKWKPNTNKIRCECHNIKDLTFGNSFFVAPNTIDFSTVFLKFSPLNQAAVIATICGVFLMYALVVVWARRKDRRDVFKVSQQKLIICFDQPGQSSVLCPDTSVLAHLSFAKSVAICLSS